MAISKEDGLDYARQVMQTFGEGTETFEEFFRLMKLFRNKFIDGVTLSSKVHTLFRGHNDLIQGFHKFYPENHDCTRLPTLPLSDGVDAREAGGSSSREAGIKGSSGKRSRPTEAERKGQRDRRSPSRVTRIKAQSRIVPGNGKESKSIDFLNTVRKRLENDQRYREFLEALCKYQAHKDIKRLDEDAFNIFREKSELHIEFHGHLVDATDPEFDQKEKRKNSRHYQEKEEENPYQQFLYDCEDEMFAADMTFHHLESAREAAKSCLEDQKEVESKKYDDEELYNASNLRLIKHLYSSCNEDDDRGYDQVVVEELLQRQPVRASELILKRLDEKLEELEAWHRKAKESWKKKIKINHEKALNYELLNEKRKSGESTLSEENDRTISHENNVEHAKTCMSIEKIQ